MNIKAIFVSPLRRALETCYDMFKNHPNKPKIIISPHFRENLLSSCDIAGNIEESM